MRATQVIEFGDPHVLVPVRLPDPVAGPGEVLVAVEAVDTLVVETQIRAGWGRDYFPIAPPYVPGSGVAGTVRALGDGVDPDWTGRRVAASLDLSGGYAELVAVPVGALTAVPDQVSLTDAAALVHDGVTALTLLRATDLRPGERVLVLGASGGMGTVLVQLAKAAGARVVGTARGDRKIALVRELGADAVVDASRPDWVEQARAALGGTGADVVLDGVGGATGAAAFPLVENGGRFSAHGAPSGGFSEVDPDDAAARGIRLFGIADVQLPADERARLVARALEEVAKGALRPVIGATFPLDQAASAHRAIESRELLGKAVITV
ncbi:zinc-binding dehydrogenase [Streptomyces uncialis]|uniref:zinc-binding dehydrogenase n=1 Tax=Streptomyces uncialis TaxID=1048205 RepID=UPI00225302CD|nr:zinc-binding dehydrogenase [Streptomyces uncialis]MCX4659333.1 zinc-binding dehydrogenase [Streptomyces uncialis]